MSPPPGYYCPENSSFPTPCPAGRYNMKEEQGSVADCLLCPVDHYNPYEAQTACFICGGEAKQPKAGQAECDCVGSGRDFQVGVCFFHMISRVLNASKRCPYMWRTSQKLKPSVDFVKETVALK